MYSVRGQVGVGVRIRVRSSVLTAGVGVRTTLMVVQSDAQTQDTGNPSMVYPRPHALHCEGIL